MKHDYVSSKIFSEEECEEIKRVFFNNIDENLQDVPAEGVAKRSKVFMARYSSVRELLYKAEQFVLDVNKNYFGYDLHSTTDHDALFLNVYDYRDHATYGWHKDQTDDSSNFDYKLTMLLNLSDEWYQGGHLHYFTTGAEKQIIEFQEPGVVCVFPSYTPHQVTNVTAGIRKTLTQFYTGPRFR